MSMSSAVGQLLQSGSALRDLMVRSRLPARDHDGLLRMLSGVDSSLEPEDCVFLVLLADEKNLEEMRDFFESVATAQRDETEEVEEGSKISVRDRLIGSAERGFELLSVLCELAKTNMPEDQDLAAIKSRANEGVKSELFSGLRQVARRWRLVLDCLLWNLYVQVVVELVLLKEATIGLERLFGNTPLIRFLKRVSRAFIEAYECLNQRAIRAVEADIAEIRAESSSPRLFEVKDNVLLQTFRKLEAARLAVLVFERKSARELSDFAVDLFELQAPHSIEFNPASNDPKSGNLSNQPSMDSKRSRRNSRVSGTDFTSNKAIKPLYLTSGVELGELDFLKIIDEEANRGWRYTTYLRHRPLPFVMAFSEYRQSNFLVLFRTFKDLSREQLELLRAMQTIEANMSTLIKALSFSFL